MAYFEQEVFVSSQNMISGAELLLQSNSSIETVVILERTPRFDSKSLDPACIKPELSTYANQVLRDQVKMSNFRDKILIGAHCLPTELCHNIYGDPTKQGYDGVHLYGPDGGNFYTRSVCNVLQTVLEKHSRASHHHQIPHYDTFSAVQGSKSSHMNNPITVSKSNADMVVIDIETEDLSHPLLYSVPTSNFFNILGN